MKRTHLRTLLHAYHPVDTQEIAYKERMLTFIDAYPDCFERTLQVGHITASAWLVNHDNSQALLMHHTKLDRWLQLGGHCDGDSDVLAVAIKEAQEESGIQHIVPVMTEIFDIDIHTIPARGQEPEHDHYDVRFLLRVVGNQEVVRNSESKELRWIEKKRESLPGISSGNDGQADARSVNRMFEKWITSTHVY
jgi:8-oxo-dGTP pyrophosphatase MutT (NUDIX family)